MRSENSSDTTKITLGIAIPPMQDQNFRFVSWGFVTIITHFWKRNVEKNCLNQDLQDFKMGRIGE